MSTHEERKNILYQRPIPNFIEEWYKMSAPCRLNQLLSYQDIAYLHEIATSVKLSGNPAKKKKMISLLMEQRGFKRLDCGTNRIVYKFMEDQSFLVKVAFDRVAINDNLRELRNQEYLRPFCAKCFEVSPCGTVGMFERVVAVKNRDQFASIADRVFDIIVNCFLGKYILADFGTEFFKNWGVRKGAFPVILDYPYLYELDPAKITCSNRDFNSPTGYCGGEIDYDDGFNFLVCKKCGKRYLASELAKKETNTNGFTIEREDDYMEISIEKNGVVLNFGEEKKTDTYKKPKLTRREYRMKKNAKNFTLQIERGDHSEILEKEKKAEEKIVTNTGAVVETQRFTNSDKNCKDLEVTIKKDDEIYVGKSVEPAYNNPCDPYTGAGYLYGTGAELVEDNMEAEVVYSTEEKYVGTNMAEIINKANSLRTDSVIEAEATVLEGDSVESEDLNHNLAAVIRELAKDDEDDTSIENTNSNTSYSVYQKYDSYGNMVSVDDPNDPDYEELTDEPVMYREDYDAGDEDDEEDVMDEYYS